MKKICKTILAFSFLFTGALAQNNKNDILQYVDPYIGTAAHGHVFLGADVPWGAVQVGPDNFVQGWDWCSGYHYSDSIVRGFSQLHLSGTGIGDLGDVLMMPYEGKIKINPKEYADKYSHTDEECTPGYYSVKLKNSGIQVQLTSSERVAYHKYIFPGNDSARVIIDLQEGIGWDSATNTFVKLVDKNTIVGYRYSKGWADDQRLWFAIKTSKPIASFEAVSHLGDTFFSSKDSLNKDNAKGILSFSKNIGKVEFKVGISPVSYENALANINAEIPGWNFDKTVAQAKDKWRKALSTVQIESNNKTEKKVFYTAMYHMIIAPVLFNDADGSYRGTDKKVYPKANFQNYTIFSLWDTYRALHPLTTILHPEKVNDFINTFLAIYQQQGKLPVWPLMGSETNCMVGYSAVPVIADAILKGYKGFDINLAYQAMKATATTNFDGLNYVKSLGFIPADSIAESVSKALEYAVDDGSIALVAKYLNKQDDYMLFKKRSEYYKKYFDTKTQFMRAVLHDGSFREPFSPFHSAVQGASDYTEGNSWQYIWLVPQDVYGLIHQFGSDESFINKLDSLFVVNGDLGPDAPPDISGLIGMYAQGDEPEHHVPYLYAYAGQQWKTAEKIHEITNKFYTDKTDGLCGNDDCGQMSAWYVTSALGFYQVNPSNGIYVFGTPMFEKMIINSTKKPFTIISKNLSEKNIYIQSVKLNGKNYTKSYITYQDIINGGNLEYTMGSAPNKSFGFAKVDRPIN
ncbi:MAG: GH92 family glycosyl hydrolase [Arachidicoccus sp.]|nr:GH92 family glycosyl hydrolase [Arachidicoccus sp.]